MPLDVLVAAITLVVFLACASIWRQRRELLKILNAPLRTEAGGDVLIGTVTALDVLQRIVRNAPGLIQHLDHLDHLANAHALLSVDQIITPHAISSALAAGDLTSDHIALAAAHAHVLDTAHGAAAHAHLAMHGAAAHADLAGHGISHLDGAVHGLDLSDLNLADAVAHVPITSVLVKGWQNWEKVEAGRLTGTEWAVHTAGGVASSTAGALVGKSVGIGAAIAAGSLFGPAALIAIPLAMFGGAVLGNTVFREMKIWWYGGAARQAEAALKEAQVRLAESYVQLRKGFLSRYRSVTRAARKQHKKELAEPKRQLGARAGFLRRLLRPTLLTVGLEEVMRRSTREFNSVTLGYYAKVVRDIRRQTAEEGGRLLFNHGKQFFQGVRAIETAYDRTRSAVESFQYRESVYQQELRALEAKL